MSLVDPFREAAALFVSCVQETEKVHDLHTHLLSFQSGHFHRMKERTISVPSFQICFDCLSHLFWDDGVLVYRSRPHLGESRAKRIYCSREWIASKCSDAAISVDVLQQHLPLWNVNKRNKPLNIDLWKHSWSKDNGNIFKRYELTLPTFFFFGIYEPSCSYFFVSIF